MPSIISEENRVASFGASVKFLKIGDKVEGTLVDKRIVSVQKYMSTEMEDKMIYELKAPKGQEVIQDGEKRVLEEDEKFVVWGKPEGKSGVDAQMKTVSVGQIIGFVFEGEKESKFKGNPTKLIQVYQNKDVIDKEWLESDEAKEMQSEEVAPELPDFTADDSDPKPVVDESVPDTEDGAPFEDVLSEIMTLSKEKFEVETDEDAKAKVIDATDLAFIKPNYGKILEKLKTL